MKTENLSWLFLVLVYLAAIGASAQTNVSSTQNNRGGTVIQPERATVTDMSPTAANLRPARVERSGLPPEVQPYIEGFKKEARKYLNQQEALKKQLEGANDQDRAAIREKLRALREQWLERARELRKEFRDRQIELVDKLPGHREVLESIRSSAQDQLRDAQQNIRTRRGDD